MGDGDLSRKLATFFCLSVSLSCRFRTLLLTPHCPIIVWLPRVCTLSPSLPLQKLSTLASLIRSSFRLFSHLPSSFPSRSFHSSRLLNMSGYSTRVVGAPNTLEHRIFIGKCSFRTTLTPLFFLSVLSLSLSLFLTFTP